MDRDARGSLQQGLPGGPRARRSRWPTSGNRVVIWDRPNCGESEVCFRGESESEMQADVLAGLLRALDLAPAVIVGGSGGARVSLLAADRHRDVARGGRGVVDQRGSVRSPVAGLVLLRAVGAGGVERRHGSGDGASELGRAPGTQPARIASSSSRRTRSSSSRRWSGGWRAYCGCAGELVPGLPDADARGLDLPTLVFRSGVSRSQSPPDHFGAARRAPPELGAGGTSLARHRMDRSGPGDVAGVRALAAPRPATAGVGGPDAAVTPRGENVTSGVRDCRCRAVAPTPTAFRGAP